MVDGEERGEREQRLRAEELDVSGAGLAEADLVGVDVGVLVELGDALVEPERKVGVARDVVRVLVIDGSVGVVAGGVETEEDVGAVVGLEEDASEVELALGEVVGGLDGLEVATVFEREDDDGDGGVGVRGGENLVKDGLHALELTGDVAGLLLVGVGDDGEVRCGDLEPDGGGVCVGADAEKHQDTERKKGEAHDWPQA